MVSTVGVVDEQPYPGPSIPDPRLPWGDPDSDPIGSIALWAKRVSAAMGRTYEEVVAHFEGVRCAYGIVDEAMDGALVAKGNHHKPPSTMASGRPAPPRHVGPRPARAFGPKGRRNF